MKKVFAILLILTGFAFAQTNSNTVTKTPVYGADNFLAGYAVTVTFTADSTGSQLTVPIEVPEYSNVDGVTYPISFRLKAVGTFGVPQRSIYLEGLFNSTTDTVAIDSVCNGVTAQTEGDTTGFLTLNKIKPALGYKIYIRSETADINSGTLNLFFPVQPGIKKKGY